MICPRCKTDAETRALVTVVAPNWRRRLRLRKECQHKFTTLETMRAHRRVREVVEAEA